MHFKKNLLQTRLSFILAIMLVNSCASTSNNDFKLLENQKQENFPELLSINDLFVINELNEDKAKNERELILELLKYESLDTNEANKLNAIIPSTLKPYGKRIIEGILQNNKKLQNSKSTNLNIKINEAVVFFESAKRIESTINIFAEYLSLDRKIVLCREMTKKYEEITRDSVENLHTKIKNNELTLKGEFVIVVEGNQKNNINLNFSNKIKELYLEHLPAKDAAKLIAALSNQNKREVYKWLIDK